MFKNRSAQEVVEADCHVILNHSKTGKMFIISFTPAIIDNIQLL